jgi:8-oxo-dGTP pyrophosphatase MutT (NUDIX family)
VNVVIPKKAASVILLRDTPQGVETFLIKRHLASGFMGGFYAFPGGNLEKDDSSDEVSARVEGISEDEAWVMLGKGASPQIALAHWVTGIREVFEEAGILFASDGVGKPISFEEEKRRRAFERYRELLNKGKITFSELCHKENLTVAAHNLIHYSHWITPENRSRRYDTHFFLAQLPKGQIPIVDHIETIEGKWLEPTEALKANASAEVPLTPPALCTLQGLASFPSVKAIMAYSKARSMSAPIIPILTHIEGQEILLMPGDELYAEHGGRKEEHYQNLHQSIRLIRKEGRWIPALPSRSDT